jgi:hypothetical protein
MPPFQGSHSILRSPSADALGSIISPFGLGKWGKRINARRRDQKLAVESQEVALGKGERNGVPNARGCRALGWEREPGTLGKQIKRELFLAAAGFVRTISA